MQPLVEVTNIVIPYLILLNLTWSWCWNVGYTKQPQWKWWSFPPTIDEEGGLTTPAMLKQPRYWVYFWCWCWLLPSSQSLYSLSFWPTQNEWSPHTNLLSTLRQHCNNIKVKATSRKPRGNLARPRSHPTHIPERYSTLEQFCNVHYFNLH